MSRMRLISVTALALVSVLALAGPASAGQGQDDSYGAAACIVQGAAGTATAGGVDDIVQDLSTDDNAWDPANLLDTDGGTFTFDSTAVVCAGADVGGETIGPAANVYSISAGTGSPGGRGVYTNLICGTGLADGSATLVGPNTRIDTYFGINFYAGVGPLTINNADGHIDLNVAGVDSGVAADPVDDPTADDPQDVDNGSGYGVVSIVPSEGNCVNEPVTEFTVNAAFVISLAGDESPGGQDPRTP